VSSELADSHSSGAGANAARETKADSTWLSQGERGALLGIHLVFMLATALGRAPMRQFMRVLALWYFAFDKHARASSRAFLERVQTRPVRALDVYRHILRFSRVTLDRIFLLLGQRKTFVVQRTGHHYLEALTRARQGAVLLGAHLGSFEAMRAGAAHERLPLNIVGHFENARMINALIERLDPAKSARVLHVGKDPIGFAMNVSERLANGELVAILADRVGLNDKQVEVDFLGAKAAFPTGPFLLASLLKCPVYLVFGLYFEPNRYELFCEPFAERIELPRAARAQALAAVVQRYATRLEHYVRLAPDNWFNFYDFWNAGKSKS
jgi:predicted LPLAT superfamily acyltransferase